MGFSIVAAVRALSRTNNNVNFATEYLLTHPFKPVPEEPPAAVQPPAAVTTAQEPVANEAPADAPMETEPVPEEQPAQETAIEEDYEP